MSGSRGLWVAVSVGLVVAILVVYRLLLPSPQPKGTTKREDGPEQTITLSGIMEPLRSKTDIGTCRSALQQLNQYLSRNPEEMKFSEEDKKQIEALTARMDPETVEEVSGRRFTTLDGKHLEASFLLRDAVRSLELQFHRGGKDREPLSRLDKAQLIFEWVVRHVALYPEDPADKWEVGGLLLPSQLILGFGRDSARSRAIVFLQMLEQLAIPAGMIARVKDNQVKYWACGVVSEKGEIYLFDPRLSLPIPGPGGQGIATLKQAQEDPTVFGQITVSPDAKYDMTPEQAQQTELHLIASLSSLAPRMQWLQKQFAEEAIHVQLYVHLDPFRDQVIDLVKKQKRKQDPKVEVAGWSLPIQRSFYGPEDGGVGSGMNQGTAMGALIPLQPFLESLPQRFWGPRNQFLMVEPNSTLIFPYFERFQNLALMSGYPRDLILRGEYVEANRALGRRREQLDQLTRQFARMDRKNLVGQIEQWHDKASTLITARGDAESEEEKGQINQQIAELWKGYGQAVSIHIEGTAAPHMLERVVYLIALSLQEQAERAWFRLQQREATPKAISEVLRYWKEVTHWWRIFDDDHGGSSFATTARFNSARAQEVLSRIYELKAKDAPEQEKKALLDRATSAKAIAITFLEQVAQESKGLQKTGCLYRVKQLEAEVRK